MQFLVIALYMYGIFQVSLGCSCYFNPSEPMWKTQLCSALKWERGFVIEATVTGPRMEVDPGQWFSRVFYSINLHGNAKEFGTSVDTSRIYTANNGALCGIGGLEKGERYVLSGYINYNGQMFVGLCNFYRKRDAITHEQNLFVKNKNLQDCPTSGCFCGRNIPYPQICRSANARNGFVITAFVTGGPTTESRSESSYAIKLTGSTVGPTLNDADVSKVYTMNGWCRLTLTQDQRYIMTGYVKDGKLYVSACDFVKLWIKASSDEKKLVKNPKQFCPDPDIFFIPQPI